jgi:hypothetical protein
MTASPHPPVSVWGLEDEVESDWLHLGRLFDLLTRLTWGVLQAWDSLATSLMFGIVTSLCDRARKLFFTSDKV